MAEYEEIKNRISLRKIKSFYNIKEIFSFLYGKLKLNLIIYNKEIKKKILVNIEDYKKISGKYRIGEKNGKGREYILNTNTLIYEGEYLNGKKNGKGKAYYKNGKLKFEGEYLNEKRMEWKRI